MGRQGLLHPIGKLFFRRLGRRSRLGCGFSQPGMKELPAGRSGMWPRQKNRSGEQVLSHRDLDPKNVLWDGMEPFLIDWEAAGYVNPERELIEVVNYWACNQRGRLDREKFRALLAAYQMNRPLLHTDWPAVLDSGYGGMLEWLLYNMKRSLGIECSSQEERRLGTAQVRGTLHALDAYERKTALLLEWLREDCDA